MSQTSDTRALESAFWDIVGVWRSDGVVEPRGKGVRAWAPKGDGTDPARRLEGNPIAAREILIGTRKAWAADLEEAVLDIEMREDAVTRVAAIRLRERRVVGPATLVDLRRDGAQALAAALAGVGGLVVRPFGFRPRAALGEVLGQCDLSPKCQIVEVALPESSDYRQFLAGSFWIDMTLNLSRTDLHAHALLRALQVRSIRSTALKTHKLGFFIGSSVKRLHGEGCDVATIAERTGLPMHTVCAWTGQAPSTRAAYEKETSDTAAPASAAPRPATDRQRAKAAHLVAAVPALSHLFVDGWDQDRRGASDLIGRGQAIRDAFADRIDAARRERAARRRIFEGRSLDSAAQDAGLPRQELERRLTLDFDVELAKLAEEIGARMSRRLDPAEAVPAD